MVPVVGLEHQRHQAGAAPAKDKDVDGHALGLFPVRADDGALGGRRRKASIGVGGRLIALGRPVQISPSSVSAALVKIEFDSMERMAMGFESYDVPGPTPKNPDSGLMAYSRPSGPIFIQAISSPMHSPRQPGIVGWIIARLVLPQADGNAAAM